MGDHPPTGTQTLTLRPQLSLELRLDAKRASRARCWPFSFALVMHGGG